MRKSNSVIKYPKADLFVWARWVWKNNKNICVFFTFENIDLKIKLKVWRGKTERWLRELVEMICDSINQDHAAPRCCGCVVQLTWVGVLLRLNLQLSKKFSWGFLNFSSNWFNVSLNWKRFNYIKHKTILLQQCNTKIISLRNRSM